MEDIIYGAVGSAVIAAGIAIVTLAFKNPQSYLKLAKLLMVFLLLLLFGYAGYALGIEEGYVLGIKDIHQGQQVNPEEIKVASWPVLSIIATFFVLFTLIWFPSYLSTEPSKKSLD